MKCPTDRLLEFMEGQLDRTRTAKISEHLETCPQCRRNLETFGLLASWGGRAVSETGEECPEWLEFQEILATGRDPLGNRKLLEHAEKCPQCAAFLEATRDLAEDTVSELEVCSERLRLPQALEVVFDLEARDLESALTGALDQYRQGNWGGLQSFLGSLKEILTGLDAPLQPGYASVEDQREAERRRPADRVLPTLSEVSMAVDDLEIEIRGKEGRRMEIDIRESGLGRGGMELELETELGETHVSVSGSDGRVSFKEVPFGNNRLAVRHRKRRAPEKPENSKGSKS